MKEAITYKARRTSAAKLGLIAAIVLVLSLPGPASAQLRAVGHPNFLSPHAAPIALGNGKLYVVNTPGDTVDVIDAASHELLRRIRVGIDPVSLALRPDGKELWVSNHVSDAVSIIDTDPGSVTHGHIIATLQDFDPVTAATSFDEPVGIAFAGNDKAYIALSSENRIAVIDVATRQLVRRITIPAQDPRAIRVRDGRLYVIPFESNNQTQISGCVGELVGDLCTFDATEHVVTNNNVLSTGIDVDIVKHPDVPDRDLFIYDTATDQLLETVSGLGTLLYGIAVNSRGRVFVAQTDARNDVNGRAGTLGDGLAEMGNRAFLNRVTWVNCSGDSCRKPRFFELEPLPPADPAPGMALATPFAIEISADDATLVLTAAGSRRLFTLDADSGAVLGRVEVGAVPRGIALESGPDGRPLRAFVLNAVDNSVSVVGLANPAEPVVETTLLLDDPTHPVVKRGRRAFNDAGASTTGTFSCESCHPDGGTDQLTWILDTPICDVPGCTQIPPRLTMPIRGLRDTAPYHWDGIPGDPYGGRNTANINGSDEPNCDLAVPESCTRNLVDGGLASTMCATGVCPVNEEGKHGALSADQRDDMAKFLLSVPYPPALRRAYTNELTARAVVGFRLFHLEGDLQGDPQPNVCGNCHRMPFWVSTNTWGTGMDAPTWRGAWDRWTILPQNRINIIDFSFFRSLALLGVPEENLWQLSWGQRSRFNPVWNMVVEGSTGFHGAFARTVTLNSASAGDPVTDDLLDALELAATEGGVVLQADGVFIDAGTGTPARLQFDHQAWGGSYVDREGNSAHWPRGELLALAAGGGFVGTATARLGPNVDVDHPQPALWQQGPNHQQLGRQVFPVLSGDVTTMTLSGRHVQHGAKVYVDGRRVPATVTCQVGDLPDCAGEVIEIRLASLPAVGGMHLVQVQNPGGLVSNDFIFHSNALGQDNCPDIPNPSQVDSDGDGIGDHCDAVAFDYGVTPGVSGAWYDPEHDGEGWFVQHLGGNRALVYWFTYNPPAAAGGPGQAWIGGVGEIRGSGILVRAADSFIGRGPAFGPGFDPGLVDLRPWGEFALNFSGCDAGRMYYRSVDPDFGHGSLELKRLSRIDGLNCEGQAAAPPDTDGFAVSATTSGAWYDPAHDGEGWVLEVLDDRRALLAWFSYRPDGRQAWLVSVGAIDGASIRFDLQQPTGAEFGPSFNPMDVQRRGWGSATLTFDDCDSGTMIYDSSLAGYGTGALKLQRLTRLEGLACE